MQNKKAILLPEVLKIIIAVLCITLLVVLAFKLYGLTTKKSDREQAIASLDALFSEIEKAGVSGEKSEFFLESPTGWGVIYWPYEEDIKPSQCVKDYCICICPGYELDDCNSVGICKDSIRKIITLDEEDNDIFLNIKKPVNLEIYLEDNITIIKKLM